MAYYEGMSDHDHAEALEPGCSQQPDVERDEPEHGDYRDELVSRLTEGEFSASFAAGYFMQMAKNLLRGWTHEDDKAGMLELIRDVEDAERQRAEGRSA